MYIAPTSYILTYLNWASLMNLIIFLIITQHVCVRTYATLLFMHFTITYRFYPLIHPLSFFVLSI